MPTLDFKGKQFVYAHHLGVPYRTLDAVPKKSVLSRAVGDAMGDGNLIIHGDNLHALKALLPRYAGRVNCVYIDPPYNTGNEGWVYNDKVNSPLMHRWLEENGEVDREDPERHDKWLCMMWPRLQLLRELLADDGVIFVSIDDNEQHRLRMVMDDIFGEGNFLNCFAWINNLKGRQISRSGAAGTHESILAYAKDGEEVGPFHPISVKMAVRLMPSAYRMGENDQLYDEIGPYVIKNELHNTNSVFNEETRPNLVFNIHYHPENREIRFSDVDSNSQYPGFVCISPKPCNDGNHRFHAWRWKREKILADSSELHFEECKAGYRVYTKIRDFEYTNLKDLITNINSNGRMLKNLGLEFPNPKPPDLVKVLVRASTKEDSIVLDSFAGSGTTAHAVLELNKEDGGDRKFILVECEDYADSITAERVRRVIGGVKDARDKNLRDGLGGEFSYCELGQELNIESMLRGDNLPDYNSLARHIAYTSTGVTLAKVKQSKDWLVGETGKYLLYLIYRPDLEFLCGADSALTYEFAETIGKAAVKKGKNALVFGAQKFASQKDLTPLGVTFCQLPYAIHRLMES